MNILFINPPQKNTIREYPGADGSGYVETDDYGYFPPLGALYVLSYAEKKHPHHRYHFIDCIGEQIDYPELEMKLKQFQPDVVGITSFTISLVDVLLVARTIRKFFPNAHLCLGGHHPTAFPYEAALLSEFDSIVVGEGEYAFADLIDCVEKKEDFADILGVYTSQSILRFRDKEFKDRRFLNHVMVPPAYVDEIDMLPVPNRKYLEHINYQSIVGLTGKLATIISSRGCPYKCTFCDVPYKKYRERNIELVMDEIEHCLSLGYEEFHFYDDLFNMTAKKIVDFCEALERRKLKIVWDFRGRVNTVTEESLRRAKALGLRMISFGVETGDDAGLRILRKGTRTEQVSRTFAWCRQLGIKTVADFMIGLPHEKTEEDIMSNIDYLISLKPDYAQINILNLYPHTQVFNQAIQKGLEREGRWEAFSLNPTASFKVGHWTEFLTEEQLVQIHRKAYRKFYFRPTYIWNSVLQTSSMHELKSKVKGVKTLLGM